MEIPIDKLLDVSDGKYKVARAAMKVVSDICNELDPTASALNKPAVFSLNCILNKHATYKIEARDSNKG